MPASSREARAAVQTFLLCTFALSLVFYLLILHAGSADSGGGLYAFGLMWSPAAGALITCLSRERPLSSLGWDVKPEYLRVAYGLPILYAGGAYAVLWLTGLGGFPDQVFLNSITSELGMAGWPQIAVVGFYVAIAATIGVIRSAAIALGVEIGWRGFLVPELFKVMSFTRTALISGALWTVWSLPVLKLANYDGAPGWRGVACFAVMTIGLSFLFTWLRLRSDSLWTTVALHASHNVFIQSIFTPLTVDRGSAASMINESGYALALSAVVVAVVVWKRRHVFDKPKLNPRHATGSPFHDMILRSTAPSTARNTANRWNADSSL